MEFHDYINFGWVSVIGMIQPVKALSTDLNSQQNLISRAALGALSSQSSGGSLTDPPSNNRLKTGSESAQDLLEKKRPQWVRNLADHNLWGEKGKKGAP